MTVKTVAHRQRMKPLGLEESPMMHGVNDVATASRGGETNPERLFTVAGP